MGPVSLNGGYFFALPDVFLLENGTRHIVFTSKGFSLSCGCFRWIIRLSGQNRGKLGNSLRSEKNYWYRSSRISVMLNVVDTAENCDWHSWELWLAQLRIVTGVNAAVFFLLVNSLGATDRIPNLLFDRDRVLADPARWPARAAAVGVTTITRKGGPLWRFGEEGTWG